MKPRTLPVKRTPVSKGIFRRLSAVTRSRKQRAATATADDELENDDHSSRISRALTIIFLIHIVVIGLIFFHQRFLDDGGQATEAVSKKPAAPAPERALPKLSSGDAIYRVAAGDNYTRIAAAQGVDEAELRAANNNVDILPGLIMKIPHREIVAMPSPEIEAIRESAPSDRERGLVEAIPVETTGAPRAQLVRPAVERPAPAAPAVAPVQAPVASGQKYVVQAGDNIWRISNKFKVDQKALMKANGISDPKKLKLGMSLTIPR